VKDVALPLYQGGMMNQFDWCASAYRRVEGKRGFKWIPIPWNGKQLEPQFLMGRSDYLQKEGTMRPLKSIFRSISASTNARTFLATGVNDLPCGNSLGVLGLPKLKQLALLTNLNSFPFDWAVRRRMGGSNLNLFVVEDLPTVGPDSLADVINFTRGLLYPHIRFAAVWANAPRRAPWKKAWAVTQTERLRLRAILEVVIALRFGLNEMEFRDICRDCDYPIDSLESHENTWRFDTKGFWRFERDLPPERRLAVVSQVAFREALKVGLDDFLGQNDGEGWMLPDTLRLADYELGHDDRAKEHQPVASALGPRFYPWQLEQSVEESWEECERHAEILGKLLPPPSAEENTDDTASEGGPADLFGNLIEADLFGEPVYKKSRKR
jgi:hypothetical protein